MVDTRQHQESVPVDRREAQLVQQRDQFYTHWLLPHLPFHLYAGQRKLSERPLELVGNVRYIRICRATDRRYQHHSASQLQLSAQYSWRWCWYQDYSEQIQRWRRCVLEQGCSRPSIRWSHHKSSKLYICSSDRWHMVVYESNEFSNADSKQLYGNVFGYGVCNLRKCWLFYSTSL